MAGVRLVAFLRAINVGGHTVSMRDLIRLFEGLGFTDVKTFIASGNVIFTADTRDLGTLERRIEAQLHDALGYEVSTFVRTVEEVAAIAAHAPFTAKRREDAGAFVVGFLNESLTPPARKALLALRNEMDDFEVKGREMYWLCSTKQSQSAFSNAVFEKALKLRSTFRGMNTIHRLAEQFEAETSSSESAAQRATPRNRRTRSRKR